MMKSSDPADRPRDSATTDGEAVAGGSRSAQSIAERRRAAASRAAAEALARRGEIDTRARLGAEQGEREGRGGLDPVRYGDWEVKGITSDF